MWKDPFAFSVLAQVAGIATTVEKRAQKLRAPGSHESGDAQNFASTQCDAGMIQNNVSERSQRLLAKNRLHFTTHHQGDERIVFNIGKRAGAHAAPIAQNDSA